MPLDDSFVADAIIIHDDKLMHSAAAPSKRSAKSIPAKQLKAQQTARYTSEIRDELFASGRSDASQSEDGLRLRQVGDAVNPNQDMDAMIKHHHDLQEKLTEEFLMLTRSLKDNVTVSGHVIQEDNKVMPTIYRNNKNITLSLFRFLELKKSSKATTFGKLCPTNF